MVNFTTENNDIFFEAIIIEFTARTSSANYFRRRLKTFGFKEVGWDTITSGTLSGGTDFADVVRFLEENHIQFAECPPIFEDWSHVLYTENGLEIIFYPVGKRSRLAIVTLQDHRKEFDRLRKISE